MLDLTTTETEPVTFVNSLGTSVKTDETNSSPNGAHNNADGVCQIKILRFIVCAMTFLAALETLPWLLNSSHNAGISDTSTFQWVHSVHSNASYNVSGTAAG